MKKRILFLLGSSIGIIPLCLFYLNNIDLALITIGRIFKYTIGCMCIMDLIIFKFKHKSSKELLYMTCIYMLLYAIILFTIQILMKLL